MVDDDIPNNYALNDFNKFNYDKKEIEENEEEIERKEEEQRIENFNNTMEMINHRIQILQKKLNEIDSDILNTMIDDLETVDDDDPSAIKLLVNGNIKQIKDNLQSVEDAAGDIVTYFKLMCFSFQCTLCIQKHI